MDTVFVVGLLSRVGNGCSVSRESLAQVVAQNQQKSGEERAEEGRRVGNRCCVWRMPRRLGAVADGVMIRPLKFAGGFVAFGIVLRSALRIGGVFVVLKSGESVAARS